MRPVTDHIRVVESNASPVVADVRFLADFVRFTPESGRESRLVITASYDP
jgi:hypothetical protein